MRMMYLGHTAKDKIFNGVELNIDVCFGNYQNVIDRSAYFLGDGKPK